MFTKIAKCILMLVIVPILVFGDDAIFNVENIQATTAKTVAGAEAEERATPGAASAVVTSFKKPTTSAAAASTSSNVKFQTLETVTETEITTTETTLASTTTTNDLKVNEEKDVDVRRRQTTLPLTRIKPDIRVTGTGAGAGRTPATTTTTSTATPTTTATTSTTTTTMNTPPESVEEHVATEDSWRQRSVQVNSSKAGNEVDTNQKKLLDLETTMETNEQQPEIMIATTEPAAPATEIEATQVAIETATKLISSEATETETPVIAHITTTPTPTRFVDEGEFVELPEDAKVVNKNLIANDFDIFVASREDTDIGESPDSMAAAAAAAIATIQTTTTIYPPDLLLPTINAFMQIESKAYQVPETLATENEHEADMEDDGYVASRHRLDIASEASRSKLNIVDLYPMKIEDFKPIIRDSNERLLKERTIFKQPTDTEDYRQNLMPNEVELLMAQRQLEQNQQPQPQPELQRHQTTTKSVNHATPTAMGETISDFTGKLLAEQDGVITEIEQKFRLNVEYNQQGSATSKTMTATMAMETGNEATTTTELTAKATEIPATTSKATLPTPMQQDHRYHHTFIDRRVKKSFDFPMHRVASDVMAMPHIDFANTKFNTDISVPGGSGGTMYQNYGTAGQHGESTIRAKFPVNSGGAGVGLSAEAAHPEFSTTKFYNSKELYNEMLLHNKRKLMKANTAPITVTTATATNSPEGIDGSSDNTMKSDETPMAKTTSGMTSMVGKLKSSTTSLADINDPRKLATATSTSIPTEAAATQQRVAITPTTQTPKPTPTSRSKTLPTTSATVTATRTTLPPPPPSASLLTTTLKPKKYSKELKRAKLLLKAMLPTIAPGTPAITATPRTTTRTSSVLGGTIKSTKPTGKTASKTQAEISMYSAGGTSKTMEVVESASTTTTTIPVTSLSSLSSLIADTAKAAGAGAAEAVSLSQQQKKLPLTTMTTNQRHILNPPKSASKPIARPRILSRLQEKINSLECEIQNVPQDSHLWRGNETHELLLPIVTSEHCRDLEQHSDCMPNIVSWEGEAEIQSGDILIVEINDAILNPNEHENNTSSAHSAQVYQVTRSGHEHCDVTEGILLDITPLVVDGRKLVTLYDKDLTEGVNLLIVVSEHWGTQCVRLKVTTKTDNCGENAECSGKGVCYSSTAMEDYECQCCSGFAGPHCEEIDACNPSPCTNNGICVDLSQGHEGNSYQCLCPYGYAGKNCQYESDPCNPAECLNGGSCVGNSTHFRCDCTPGYTGPLCQHSLNECESSPCVHGICVDQEDGFRCFCQPGFAGELCNFEYNECESNPCQNSGECIDHIGSYECRCTKGYTGNRCQIKVDFCANKPCPEGQRCIDHGNDFSCECPGGRNGPDCNQMPRTYFQQCNVNPCTHGGTCWSSGDSFYCACRPGYTGTMCEDEFVVETVVSSSEFIVDDTSARNFNDKTFGSSVVLKSPIELHNAYFAAGVLAAAIFIVAVVVTICHCKVNQTYRKFSTRTTSFFPILGFNRRPKLQNKLNKHWLSGKSLGGGNSTNSSTGSGVLLRSSGPITSSSSRHLAQPNVAGNAQNASSAGSRQLHERPFQRHLAMNLENDMYYTVDFSENSQHSPLIQ